MLAAEIASQTYGSRHQHTSCPHQPFLRQIMKAWLLASPAVQKAWAAWRALLFKNMRKSTVMTYFAKDLLYFHIG